WFTATWLRLGGSSVWWLRIALTALGLAGAGLFLWWYRKMAQRQAGMSVDKAGSDETDVLVHDAAQRLRTSQRGLKLKELPLIYVLGPAGATKTTTVVNSSLEPELLAGQVYQDNNVVPTRSANLWYTRETLLMEACGALLNHPARWARLIRNLQPGKLASAMSRSRQAPRAALVCFDCEAFLQPGASEAVPASARLLNTRLREVSEMLGINLPVYVLFTKLDRLPFFADYVRNLSDAEAAQVLGATLRMRTAGVYAEEQTRDLNKAFDDLFCSLAEKRIELLAREAGQSHGGIYEFPREFRKLRTLLVQFLVDMARPSQLTTNPFLRGFYFSGVRAVMVADSAQPAAVRETAQAARAGAGATRMFNFADARPAAAVVDAPARAPALKKVPQWILLPRLFHDVLVKDQVAMGASGFSAKVSMLRRVLLAASCVVCLIAAIGFIVSFTSNRKLETQINSAASQLQSVRLAPGELPSLLDLQRLDSLRGCVETLQGYRKDGAPWSMRWGLFVGNSILPDAKKIYFARFQQLMFGASQQALLANLQKLPAAPGAGDSYGAGYDTLKAYLITTSNHDKSTKLFLAPVLVDRWLAGRELDAERSALARAQFEFYAGELASENPFSAENDSLAVERGRSYLSKFAAIDRMYRALLDEANRKSPPIRFNSQFPGSANAVIDNKEVEGAFSKDGFAFVQDAIANSSRFFAGEEWVLGTQTYGNFDRAAMEGDLRARYRSDFVEQWRAFLKAATVLRYGGPADAARKLTLLSGNQSPLLALFWLASTHTAVADPEIAGAFQSVQAVVPPGADRYVSATNQPYMTALASLQTATDQLAKSPAGMNDLNAVGLVRSSAMSAMQAARQTEQGFTPDRVGQVDTIAAALMEAPIKAAEGILRPPGLDGGAVAALCTQFARLGERFPFNSQSKVPAGMAEVNALYQPGSGALWQFYEQHLKPLVLRQGGEFVVNPASGARISPRFLSFFSNAALFSETVYPAGSTRPNLAFRLKPYPAEGISGPALDINGQTLAAPGGPRQFTWDGGDMSTVRVSGKLGSADVTFLSYAGSWAVFQFFSEADRWQTQGNVSTVEWTPRSGASGQPMIVAGRPLTLRYDLELSGAPVFSKSFLASLRCSR
ncbi:MAG TPA: ImcF-related family protein, partial [Terriglobales bacterium]|nr:ImcF-related family protein [Terriglobales bacterium]